MDRRASRLDHRPAAASGRAGRVVRRRAAQPRRPPRQGPLRLEYSRFVRYRAPEVLTVQVDPGVSGETLQLWVDRAYLEDFELQQIVPAPDQTRLLPDRILYEFQAQPGDGPLRVTFQLRPQAAGSRSGRVGLEGGDTVTFRQFVYP